MIELSELELMQVDGGGHVWNVIQSAGGGAMIGGVIGGPAGALLGANYGAIAYAIEYAINY